jgi:hypothetical protein
MELPDIAIGGRMQAGKTTCAQWLVARHGYVRRALADPIKDLARVAFGWDGRKDERGRRLLQELGTAGRHYDPDCWLRRLDAVLSARRTAPVVVDDVRLAREVDHLRARRFVTLLIERPGVVPEPAGDPTVLVHETETGLEGVAFDAVLVNGGTLEDLYAALERVLSPWLGAAHADAPRPAPAD